MLNSKIDHPAYQCDHTDWGINICRWVDSPRVKLLYDGYHIQVMEGDIIRTIREYHAFFGHYHVAGNPGRHEPDETQEINYSAVFRAIHETGYDGFVGFVGMEFIPGGDPLASLKAAFELGMTELGTDDPLAARASPPASTASP